MVESMNDKNKKIDCGEKIEWNSTYDLLTTIANAIYNKPFKDGSNAALISLYNESNEEQRDAINRMLAVLCGHTLPELVEFFLPAYVYDITWDIHSVDVVTLPEKVYIPDYIRDDILYGPDGLERIVNFLKKTYGFSAVFFRLSDDFADVYENLAFLQRPKSNRKGEGHVRQPLYAYDIEWDKDGDDINLPDKVVISDLLIDLSNPYDTEMIADYLSDLYGFCVKGFKVDNSEKNRKP